MSQELKSFDEGFDEAVVEKTKELVNSGYSIKYLQRAQENIQYGEHQVLFSAIDCAIEEIALRDGIEDYL